MSFEEHGKKDIHVEITFIIRDETGQPVNHVEFEYEVNGKDDDMEEETHKDGKVTFHLKKFKMKSGDTITITIDKIEHDKEDNWSYDPSANKVSFPLVYTIS